MENQLGWEPIASSPTVRRLKESGSLLGFHQYADDTQIYGYCNNEGTEKLQMRVSECVDVKPAWMGANRLKPNSEKTERIWFSSHRNPKNIPSYSVRVLEINIFPSKSLRNLGGNLYR